jgi:hypothetical protein
MSTIDFESIATSIGKLVASKNKSYGNSFQESGKIIEMLYPNGIPVEKYTSVLALIRIIDKLYRIATQPDFNGEDAWRDIAGYAILMSGYEDAKRGKNTGHLDSTTFSVVSKTSGFTRLDEVPILGNNKTIPILGPKPSPAMEEWAKSSTIKEDGLKGIDTSNVAKELTEGIEVSELVEKLVENQINLKSQADLADTIFNNTYNISVNSVPESNQDLTDSGIK